MTNGSDGQTRSLASLSPLQSAQIAEARQFAGIAAPFAGPTNDRPPYHPHRQACERLRARGAHVCGRCGLLADARTATRAAPLVADNPKGEVMDDELKALLEKARNHKMTPVERFEQRVSFVFSGAGEGVTREQVRAQLAEEYGDPAAYEAEITTLRAQVAALTDALGKARDALRKVEIEGHRHQDTYAKCCEALAAIDGVLNTKGSDEI